MKRDEFIKKLHPSITHITASDNMSEETLEAINIMVDKVFKMTTKEIKGLVSENKIAPVDMKISYGDYVMMDDRFESVHIWSKKLEKRNAGRWTPYKITKEKYDKEMQYDWNKK